MDTCSQHRRPFLFIILLLVAVAVGCRPVTEVEPDSLAATPAAELAQPLAIPGAAPDTTTPAGVVEAFYTAYLDNEPPAGMRQSPFLSERLIAAIAAAEAAGPLGADPFLLAQQEPAALRVEPFVTGETTARVVLRLFWVLGEDEGPSHDLTIDLSRGDSGWQIDTIQTGNPTTPDGVVQLFYNWYFGEGEGAAYQESPYLTPAFIAAMGGSAGPSYEALLRARNWPTSFFVLRHEMDITGDEATVPVQMIYGRETTVLMVNLLRQPAQWRIAGVTGELPDEATSASQVVDLFSQTYFRQWYDHANRHNLPHTGMVDLSDFLAQEAAFYQESPYLSPAFAAAAKRLEAGENPEDPFFLAAGVPAMMEVESAWVDGDHAEVRVIQRWAEGRESRALTVTLEAQDGHWLISGVVVADAALQPEQALPEPAHPSDTLRSFFAAYLELGGYAGGGHLDNEYLSPALLETLTTEADYYRTLDIPVDAIDPILHTSARVVPGRLTVEIGEATILEDGHFALARVDRIFRDSGVSLPLQVLLVRDEGAPWRIQQVDAIDPQIAGDAMSDEMWLAVHIGLYYKWAVGYADRPGDASQLIDLLRFEMEAAGGITFCSDTWPDGFVVESVYIEPDAEFAWTVLRTSEANTLLVLQLEKRDWTWVIVDQECAASPAGRARAFLTHYLGYAGDPWAAHAYRYGDYLTMDLIQRLDAQVDSGAADPFRPTPGATRWFDAVAEPAGNRVLVTMTMSSGSTLTTRLSFVLVDGRWLISDVESGRR
jgi:hypothetical protein